MNAETKNKTAALADYLSVYSGRKYPGPDCRNRHPGKGWAWSPSQTATKASPISAKCWHGSNPTPGTQLPAEIARDAADWLAVWELGYIIVRPRH